MTSDKARKTVARAHAQATGVSYTRALREVTAEPPAIEVWTEEFDGPHWGGGLHTHGLAVTVFGRTEGGTGAWLTPDSWPGDRTVLNNAARGYIGPDGHFDLDWPHFKQSLTAAFPGAQIVFEGSVVECGGLDDEEIPTLIKCKFTRDCMDPDCGEEL